MSYSVGLSLMIAPVMPFNAQPEHVLDTFT